MKLLQDKVALITGAARGIGKAIATKYAEAGCHVAISDLKVADEAKDYYAQLAKECGVTIRTYESNAADFEAAHQLIDQIVADFGKLDVLVNNAGITRDGLLLRMSEQQWDAVINVNLKSAFNMTHAVAPIMMKQRQGSIINMASVVGVSGNAGQVNYSASKAGMIALAKSVAKELGSRGIRANSIAPGFIESDMTAVLSEEVRKEWAKQIPLRRGGKPEDVANVALFLASDLSSYMTGQVLSCCGGMNM